MGNERLFSCWTVAIRLLAGLAFAVAALCPHGATASGELPDGATVLVAPLTRAMWNQGRHYNRMCPLGLSSNPDGRMYAGCTAVATAIILDYYKWPLQGTGDTKYDEAYWPLDSINLRARFDLPYDWDGMRETYGHVVSARASLAIATLMSDVGAVLSMNYGTSGSSTQFDKIAGVLGQHFRFDNSYAPTLKDFDADGHAVVQMQLMAGHPILCSGAANASGVGHTYVCDGFATTDENKGAVTNLYHFNFGWGGTNNGWYPLDAVFTSALPGEPASSQPVDEMLLGVFPERAPLFARRPEVVGPDVTVAWGIATCWTNYLDGLVLERQTLQNTTVNTEIKPTDWTCHSDSTGTYGWEWQSAYVSGRTGEWDGGYWGITKYWPGQGNCIGLTKGVAISKDTTVTIGYKAVKLPTGVSIKLTKCVWDAGVGEWGDYDPVSYATFQSLATLPCGDSSALETMTATISGEKLVVGLGGASAEVHFAIKIEDSRGVEPSFVTGTEIFRLESFVVSGEAEDWATVEERELSAEVRSAGFSGLAAGNHRFVITAKYADGDASRTSEQRVSNTLRVPTVCAVETNLSSVVFAVSDADDFGYSFEKQSNSLKGTAARNGSRVTYTFDKPVAQLGSHWLTLTVSNRVNGLVGKCVHITNPPQNHPLCGDVGLTVADAAARAKREGKLVLLLSSGEADSVKFQSLSGILSSNDVVRAIRDKYVLVEACATNPDDYALAYGYWRPQPAASYGGTIAGYMPLITLYGFIVNPDSPSEPMSGDALPSSYAFTTRWAYLNSQLDVTSLLYAPKAVSDIVQFLGQEFAVAVHDVVELAPDGTLTNITGIAAENIKVVHTAMVGGTMKTYDITSAFTKTGNATDGVTLKLSAGNVVTAGGETITVEPVMAAIAKDDLVADAPFAMTDGGVAVGVKSIPGLTYELLRSDAPGDARNGTPVDTQTADGVRVRLADAKRPVGRAFYVIRVSVR